MRHQLRTNLVVGAAATFAAMAFISLRQRLRDARLASSPHAEIVWEGEGGNVPEVALENGNQGRSLREDPPAHASDVHPVESFEFPRS